MSILVISYTVLIEYKTGVSRYSQTPQDNVVVLGSSSVFLSANSALSFSKMEVNMICISRKARPNRATCLTPSLWTCRELNAGILGASEVFYH